MPRGYRSRPPFQKSVDDPATQALLEQMRIYQAELEQQNEELIETHAETEQARARAALLFANLPLPGFVLDRRGMVRSSNAAASSAFSSTLPLIGICSIYRLLAQADDARLHDMITGVTLKDGAAVVPNLLIKGAGERIMDAHLVALPDTYDTRDQIQLLLVDRTAEVGRMRDRALFEAIADNADTALHAFDSDGRCILANKALKRIWRGSADTALRENPMAQALFGRLEDDLRICQSGVGATFETTWNGPGEAQRSFVVQKFPLRDERGHIYAVGGITTEVTQWRVTESVLQQTRERADYLSKHDSLTLLPNRSSFLDSLNTHLLRAKRDGTQLSVLFLDVDGFKDVNDTLGHDAGDALLAEVARRVRSRLRPEDVAARTGGDEFLVLLPTTTREEADRIIASILQDIRLPFLVCGNRVFVTCSIGSAHFPEDSTNYQELVTSADIAMYAAKANGRNQSVSFDNSMKEQSSRRARILHALRKALWEESLRLVFQPKVSLHKPEELVGAEALLRWHDPELGEISPVEFIPIAEAAGMIHDIDKLVVRLFARAHARLSALGCRLRLSFNVSAKSLQNEDYVRHLLETLKQHQIDPNLVIIEITETGLMSPAEVAVRTVGQLRAVGLHWSADDFGTGYSSLAYLQRLPLSELKIDTSFVAKLGDPEQGSDRIVKAILALAQSLNIQTVAEGIETPEQKAWLAANGCDVGQGWLFSRALEVEAFESLYSVCTADSGVVAES